MVAGVFVTTTASTQLRAQPSEPQTADEIVSSAEDPPFVMGAFAGTMRFSHMGEEEGLPAAGIYAIAQDGPGFMWFGTREGLVRYDGNALKVYNNKEGDETSLSHDDVTALATDKEGRLWVGTAQGGLNRYENSLDTFVRIRKGESDDNLASDSISALHIDQSGKLWIAYQTGGLGVMDPTSTTVEPIAILESSTVVDITESKEGILYLATARAGVLGWDRNNNRTTAIYRNSSGFTVQIPADEITSVLVDSAQRLWIGTSTKGLVRIDGDKVTPYRHDANNLRTISDDRIEAIFEGPDRSVWIGTETGGLNTFDEKRGTFVQHRADDSEPRLLSGTWITGGFTSRDGVCWVSTLSGGINYFTALNRRFEYFPSDGTVTAVAPNKRDSRFLWMATEEGQGGLYRVNRLTGEHQLFRFLGDPADAIRLDRPWLASILDDGTGTVWIGTGGSGLLGFKPDSGAVTQFAVSQDEEDFGTVTAIHRQKDGALWLGTWGQGLVFIDPSDSTFRSYLADFDKPEALTSDHIYAVVPDRADPKVLWLGTAQGGLNRFETETGRVTRFLHKSEDPSTLSDDNVLSIFEDKKGQMWLGTYGGGLNKFDKKGTFEHFQGPGHPATIYGIIPDESGMLWMSTNGDGLRQFNPETKESVAFTRHDGIQSNIFAQGASASGELGMILFGGINGVTAFRPNDIRPDNYAPPIVLTEFQVFGETKPLPKGVIDLSYRDAVISFRFAGMSFAAPEEVRFEYKMDGLHDWIRTSDTSVNYTSLDPGDYKFHLRAIGRHGAISEATIDVPISVSPPPWRTWWAYAIYVLIIVGLIALYVRRQRAKLKEVEKEARLAFAERELELTAAVQQGFLPTTNTVVENGFNLVGYYNAAEQCSGDWWWHEKLGENRHLVVVGDVTGHGAAPAMVTASVGTTFRVMRNVWEASGPAEFLRVANDEVRKSGRGEYMMQLIAAELNTATGELTIHSAAGLPAVCVLNGKLKMVAVSGLPLGSDKFESGASTIQLAPGDRFMLLTDGIPEIPLANGRLFGLRNVGKTYAGLNELPLNQAAEGLLQAARTANVDGIQRDDWTFVVGEWSVDPSSFTGTDLADGSVVGLADGSAASFGNHPGGIPKP